MLDWLTCAVGEVHKSEPFFTLTADVEHEHTPAEPVPLHALIAHAAARLSRDAAAAAATATPNPTAAATAVAAAVVAASVVATAGAVKAVPVAAH